MGFVERRAEELAQAFDPLAARGAGLHAVWANPLALPRPDTLPRDVPALDRFDELDDVLDRLAAREC